MKTLYLIPTLLISIANYAQSVQIDVNSINATIENTGALFSEQGNSQPGFETENGSDVHSIYSTSLWMGGLDGSSNLLGAFGSFGQNTESYTTGPLTITPGTISTTNEDYGPALLTTSAQQNFSGVYCVTSAEVVEFVQFSSCDADPSCNTSVTFPTYTIPNSILNWPAHGDVSNNESSHMAPFVDIDGDGVYNPMAGDYPCIKGDKYAWLVINDRNPNNTLGSSIGVEIHVEVYAFDRVVSNPLNQTVFVGYNIINRSTQTLTDFYIGAFTDLDIGCYQDDFIGSIPELNSLFGYNSTNNDVSCFASNGYGTTPPAQGVTLLNNTLVKSISFNSGPTTYNSYPIAPTGYYNYLQGKFRDGSDLFYGGDGHNSSTGVTTTPTDFQYPQTPPTGMANWTEVTQANQGGNRFALGCTGPFTFTPGMKIEFDLAFVYARAASGDHLASIPLLENNIELVQTFYDDSINECYLPTSTPVSVKENTIKNLQVYPNPSSGKVFISVANSETNLYEVTDLYGKTVQKGILNNSKSINIASLSAGIYMVNLFDENRNVIGFAKVIRE